MNRVLLALFTLLSIQSVRGQTNGPTISAVCVLTIHVRDTNVHQSVFQFLTDTLKLPVEYGPTQLGARRYAAVYAGNLFIEPCGPFVDRHYPVKDFEALFYGLNCRTEQTPAPLEEKLRRLNVSFTQLSAETFQIENETLAGGIYLAVSAKSQSPASDAPEQGFRATLKANQSAGPGLEYVKEILIGYTEPDQIDLWSQFLGSATRVDGDRWSLEQQQSIRLRKSAVRGVIGVVWKAQSLDVAETYFKKTHCFGRRVDGRIELDQQRTFGLLICVSEK